MKGDFRPKRSFKPIIVAFLLGVIVASAAFTKFSGIVGNVVLDIKDRQCEKACDERIKVINNSCELQLNESEQECEEKIYKKDFVIEVCEKDKKNITEKLASCSFKSEECKKGLNKCTNSFDECSDNLDSCSLELNNVIQTSNDNIDILIRDCNARIDACKQDPNQLYLNLADYITQKE
ncbi:hypothetical protein D6745_02845 [Candidatus Woesearchaeota archaeon]|nr:MAG: hypothetical protein D6745_02845 [Candidatus Woesearchaeota archaeon]